jgi:branched-chain amino acid transport system ATP-binding protein
MAVILKAENLTRRFWGLTALDAVDIELREGEILGIIGPNGSGKTTFTNVVCGIYLPTSGKVVFDGKDITELPAHTRCRLGIARTFQLCRPLADLKMVENVMTGALFGRGYGMNKARSKTREICEFVGLPQSNKDVSKLTALEIKKVELARALATEPKVVFLDELMAGLSTDECQEIMELVRKIRERGINVCIIEHVMRVISELTDRVVVLDGGQKIADGPYEEVSSNPKVISAYLGEEA